MTKTSGSILFPFTLGLLGVTALSLPPAQARPAHHHARPVQTQPTSTLASQMDPTNTSPTARTLTPAQQVALPDGGAPPPPHGYTETVDSDPRYGNYSPAVTALHGPGLPGGEAHQNVRQSNNVPSHFSVLGMPVKFNAPVQPPYNGEATYKNYAGQPANRWDGTSLEGSASPQP